MFRNIEFAAGTISLAALIACAVYPVLPVWGLVIFGVNSLVCFAGGLAFQMKHDKESEDIDKAKKAVEDYKPRSEHGSGDPSHREPPPPYSPQYTNADNYPTAPPYSQFDDSNATWQKSGNYM